MHSRLGTGSIPGIAASTRLTCELGSAPNAVAAPLNSFDWLITGYAGYRFNLGRSRYYLIPQVGVANVAYKSNPWPIFEDKTLTREVGEQPFVLGALRFGFSF